VLVQLAQECTLKDQSDSEPESDSIYTYQLVSVRTLHDGLPLHILPGDRKSSIPSHLPRALDQNDSDICAARLSHIVRLDSDVRSN
jgi:hypothetical protein